MKEIPGFNGWYFATECGEIYSKERTVVKSNGTIQLVKSQQMRLQNHGTGYLSVGLSNSTGKKKTYRVHRLIASTFIPNLDSEKDVVNHLDGNKVNNHVSNLEWCSIKENTVHAIAMGLHNPKGVNNGSAKLTLTQLTKSLEMVAKGIPLAVIAKEFFVVPNTISKALVREFGTGWKVHQKEQYRPTTYT